MAKTPRGQGREGLKKSTLALRGHISRTSGGGWCLARGRTKDCGTIKKTDDPSFRRDDETETGPPGFTRGGKQTNLIQSGDYKTAKLHQKGPTLTGATERDFREKERGKAKVLG